MTNEGIRLLDTQLSWLDRYKRFSQDAVIRFYSTSIANGGQLPTEIRFPLREDESRVATVYLTMHGAEEISVKGRIVLTQGELLAIEFNKSPRNFKTLKILSARVETHLNPMMSITEESKIVNTKILDSLLGRTARFACDLTAALPLSKRTAIIEALGASLPSEYLKWIEVVDGFTIGKLKIYGLKDIWSAPRPDGLFYVFAAVQGEADLAVKGGEGNGKIYWLGYESSAARVLDADLTGMIIRYGQ